MNKKKLKTKIVTPKERINIVDYYYKTEPILRALFDHLEWGRNQSFLYSESYLILEPMLSYLKKVDKKRKKECDLFGGEKSKVKMKRGKGMAKNSYMWKGI